VTLLILANVLWAVGTLIVRGMEPLESPFLFSALQMGAGACVTSLGAFVFEHPAQLFTASIAPQAIYSLMYLITFGSLVGYTAYSFLSRTVEPHLIATYALVNPVIAVGLGCVFLSEPLSIRFVFSTFFVLFGLGLLLRKPKLSKPSSKQDQAIAS
jgi:drug/metabolite transporter (DMT)-like permease